MSSNRWTVLIPDQIDRDGLAPLDEIADLVTVDEYKSRDSLLEDADQFDAIVWRSGELDGEFIRGARNLKIITKHGAGYDNIDIDVATGNNVLVCNTPGTNSRSVAEHTLSLILCVNQQLLPANGSVKAGKWDRHRFSRHELSDKTLGLYGYGNIARHVVTLARPVFEEIVTYDPYVSKCDIGNNVMMVEEDAFFGMSDVVSVHCPLTPDTKHAISKAELEALPDNAVVVNTSRGGIVDESALVNAIEAGHLLGAGVDVFANEPPSADHPLLECKNVVATPHMGGISKEALYNTANQAAHNVVSVYNERLPDSALNAHEIESDLDRS